MATPDLPTHFPCWVKAIYSWGGEASTLKQSKRDLGFIEGDLIECLNAGDGMWWMGRLRRDRRMIGLFPSNFVTILESEFRPVPHRSSPLASQSASRSNSQNTSISHSVSPSKSLFRSPFKAYALAQHPNPEAAARDIRERSGTVPSPTGSLTKMKTRPFSSMQNPRDSPPPAPVAKSRPPSPTTLIPIARGTSPRPSMDRYQGSRSASPMPYHQTSVQHSRATSPVPYDQSSRQPSRATSPAPYRQILIPSRQPSPAPESCDGRDSEPPPPPPAHRIAYTRHASPEPDHYQEQNFDSRYPGARTPSPAPSDQRSSGMTPSPLRDAMNDVMTSLEGMSVQQRRGGGAEEPREPFNPWSPEAFDQMSTTNLSRSRRPHTSLGIGKDEDEDDPYQDFQQPHELTSYVQRMESRLRQNHHNSLGNGEGEESSPPAPRQQQYFGPSKPQGFYAPSRPGSSQADSSRPSSSYATSHVGPGRANVQHSLKSRKSAYELGRERLNRTFTTKSSVTTASSTAHSTSTNNSSSTQATSQSIMSGHSAGGFSATSAGSLARHKWGRSGSIKGRPMSAMGLLNPPSGLGTVSYHSSHDSNPSDGMSVLSNGQPHQAGLLGGLSAPVPKKRGFLGKMIDTVKTTTATARSNISTASSSRPQSRQGSVLTPGVTSIAGPSQRQSVAAARDMGLGGTGDWVQMRRDVNRSNSLSRNERDERIERCQMSDIPVMSPVEALNESVEGDEAADGQCVSQPTDIGAINLSMVDKSARFVNNLPALVNAASLAQGYLCRPYKSDMQRLRAIFTWVSERVTWEEDFEGDVDARRVIQTKRGCSEDIAILVAEMCAAIGVHVEVIRGHLKVPGELNLTEDLNDAAARPNHWWNAVIADGEWRILDCSLANPTNPRRSLYSSTNSQMAESWWFLTRPTEICYTHVPLLPEQQHIVPPVAHDILMALPITSPPYFRNNIQMWDFDTSLVNLEGLEMAHVQLSVPDEIECTATVSARSFSRDADGDFFESGEYVTKRALAQGEFVSCDGAGGAYNSFKRYTIKAFVPASSHGSTSASVASTATLNIYAGRRGLMHSINSNPHALAISLPLVHTGGPNPAYEFFTRHPTPHALRHELYVSGPLCKRLVLNNTFVFTVRQHPASSNWQGVEKKERPSSPSIMRPGSAMSLARPSSAMSMASISASGSSYSNPSASGSDSSNNGNGTQPTQQKPAKLAIQSPSGKILRMTRKAEPKGRGNAADEDGVVKVGSTWETIIKIGERGTWRGLVLADRSARWCVWGEWDCL